MKRNGPFLVSFSNSRSKIYHFEVQDQKLTFRKVQVDWAFYPLFYSFKPTIWLFLEAGREWCDRRLDWKRFRNCKDSVRTFKNRNLQLRQAQFWGAKLKFNPNSDVKHSSSSALSFCFRFEISLSNRFLTFCCLNWVNLSCKRHLQLETVSRQFIGIQQKPCACLFLSVPSSSSFVFFSN